SCFVRRFLEISQPAITMPTITGTARSAMIITIVVVLIANLPPKNFLSRVELSRNLQARRDCTSARHFGLRTWRLGRSMNKQQSTDSRRSVLNRSDSDVQTIKGRSLLRPLPLV